MRGNLRGKVRQNGRLIERLPPPEAPSDPGGERPAFFKVLPLSTLRSLLDAMRAQGRATEGKAQVELPAEIAGQVTAAERVMGLLSADAARQLVAAVEKVRAASRQGREGGWHPGLPLDPLKPYLTIDAVREIDTAVREGTGKPESECSP